MASSMVFLQTIRDRTAAAGLALSVRTILPDCGALKKHNFDEPIKSHPLWRRASSQPSEAANAPKEKTSSETTPLNLPNSR
jgi:hypothetical protein